MLNTMKNFKYTGLIISLFIFVSVVLLDQNMLVNKVSARKAETQKLPNPNRDKTSGYFPQNGNSDLFENGFNKSVQNENQLLTSIQNEIQTSSLDSNISGNWFDYNIPKRGNGTVSTKFDFDGDGKTDISIFRPSLGEWWIMRSSDGSNVTVQLGNSSDKLIPKDFLGDGSTDIGILSIINDTIIVCWFNTETGAGDWVKVELSIDNTSIPVQLDNDGDGIDDLTVFHPSDSIWTIKRSSDGQIITKQFGVPTDKPVAADYDGDGKGDIAIFRPSNGQWWIERSSDGAIQAIQFGVSTDRPIQADYTGDGKADIAVWRPSTGEWFVLRSEDNSYYAFSFGSPGDIPVPGDYDGDGKSDAAVYRPSNNVWYINRSTGVQYTQFGASGDIPIPSVYVP